MSNTSLDTLIAAWRDGDENARNEVFERFYAELSQLASRYLHREQRGMSMSTGDLVHEAVSRMLVSKQTAPEDVSHLLALSATVMRQVMVDRARMRNRHKRRGIRVTFSDNDAAEHQDSIDIIALDQALQALRETDGKYGDVFEMRYFAGMTYQEIADVIGSSRQTVERIWKAAATWVYESMNENHQTDE